MYVSPLRSIHANAVCAGYRPVEKKGCAVENYYCQGQTRRHALCTRDAITDGYSIDEFVTVPGGLDFRTCE